MIMHRTRIKICGVTRPQDAAAAVAAGADAVGVVLAPSKREITLERAAEVLAGVPPFVARVGVFVDPGPEQVRRAVKALGLSVVQLHGDEAPDVCAASPAPVVKAFSVGPGFDPACAGAYRGVVRALLVDASAAGMKGGTGATLDWHGLAGRVPAWAPVILAGGLCPSNVGEAIGAFRPFAVDVSSGVESSPGVKDCDRMNEFCAAVRAADMEV